MIKTPQIPFNSGDLVVSTDGTREGTVVKGWAQNDLYTDGRLPEYRYEVMVGDQLWSVEHGYLTRVKKADLATE